MTERILFVDDDENLLAGYKRHLRKLFSLSVAASGQDGLRVVEEEGPFAIVVSDMKMPGMNGIDFLAKVREVDPDVVRMMLTGFADVDTAIASVNEGNIFRFLTKPCDQDTLSTALQAGLQQHKLITAERELLEKTLRGSVGVLVEILSLVNPIAFGRATRVRRYVKHIVSELDLQARWQYEVAAMLSQLGCVTLPTSLLEKVTNGEPLSPEESKMYSAHPEVGARLLADIPRLHPISYMIQGQETGVMDGKGLMAWGSERADTELGAKILKVALDFDLLMTQGKQIDVAISEMISRKDTYDPRVLSAMETLETSDELMVTKSVTVMDLTINMIADEDIKAMNGLLLLQKDQKVTPTVLARLRNFSIGVGVQEPLRVRTLVDIDNSGEAAS